MQSVYSAAPGDWDKEKWGKYGLPKETITAINRNTKAIVRSPVNDTDFFDIVSGIWQGDTLALYVFIIRIDFLLRTSIDLIFKKKGFLIIKKRQEEDDVP